MQKTIYFQEDTDAKLTHLASIHQTSQSDIIRRLIDAAFEDEIKLEALAAGKEAKREME